MTENASGVIRVEIVQGAAAEVTLQTAPAAEVELRAGPTLHYLPDGALDGYYSKAETAELLSTKSDSGHSHDERYYTETETAALLGAKSDTGHTHDERYYTEAETDALLSAKSDTGHTHDERYYTEAETDAAIAAAVGGCGKKVLAASVAIPASWTDSGSGWYTATPTVTGAAVSTDSKIDLQPDAAALISLRSDDVAALYIENNAGVLTAYAVGGAPASALTMQCTVTEVGT